MSADETLMWDEIQDIGSLLHELDDADFDRPSLCDGWAVRDVHGHMGLGHTTPMLAMTGRIARYGFNVTKASFNESKSLFSGSSPDQIRRFWDDVMVAGHPRKGISKMVPTSAGFLDHLGDGPVVSGPGEAIIVATFGRRAALGELDGDGVAVLRERLAV